MMKQLKSNKGRTKINFGEMVEPKASMVPSSLADNEIFTYNLSMLDQFDPEKLLILLICITNSGTILYI